LHEKEIFYYKQVIKLIEINCRKRTGYRKCFACTHCLALQFLSVAAERRGIYSKILK